VELNIKFSCWYYNIKSTKCNSLTDESLQDLLKAAVTLCRPQMKFLLPFTVDPQISIETDADCGWCDDAWCVCVVMVPIISRPARMGTPVNTHCTSVHSSLCYTWISLKLSWIGLWFVLSVKNKLRLLTQSLLLDLNLWIWPQEYISVFGIYHGWSAIFHLTLITYDSFYRPSTN